MNSITVHDKNPFLTNKMESMCIVCTRDLSQCGGQQSKSIKTVLPEIEPPTKVFEALKLISNISVDNEELRVCLLCYHNTSLAIWFQWLCNQSAANIKACIDNQTVAESDEAPDKQELNKNETNNEIFLNSMKVEVIEEELVIPTYTLGAEMNQQACEVVVEDANIAPDLDDNKDLAKPKRTRVWDTTKVQCSHCHKMIGINYLKIHMRTHTGDMPFKCKVCKKGFPARNAYVYHMRTHDDQKQHLCTFCGEKFRMRGNLNKHIRIHTGERPYSCEICGKTFSDSGGRNSHRTTHSDERPFACDECPKKFSLKHHLRNHKFVHLKVKPIECMHCKNRFTTKYNLKQHQAKSCKGIHSI